MLTYPITLERDDNSTILASFGPLGGYTYGRDRAEALHHAGDAIEVAIMGMMSLGDDIPAPSARIPTGAPTVTLGSQAECKIVIYRAMREAKVHKAKLARRLGVHRREIDRLMDLRHATRFYRIDQALAHSVSASGGKLPRSDDQADIGTIRLR